MKPAVKWGLISAILSILFFVIGASTGLIFKPWYSFAGLLITLLVLILGVREARALAAGDFPFGKAFGVGFQIVLISSVISVLFNLLYTTVINPDYYAQAALATEEMLTSMNVPQDQIDKAVEDARNPNIALNVAIGLGGALAIGAIIAAIVGAIMKREEKISA